MQTIFTDSLEQAFAHVGVDMPKVNGSKLVRFSTNGKSHDKAGWLRLFDDNTGAVFGDFRSGDTFCWQKSRDSEMTPVEMAELRAKVAEHRAQAEEEQRQAYADAAEQAKAYLEGCEPATDHPYLTRKGISPCGVFVSGDKLVIPVTGVDGVQSLQRIGPDGDKKFMPGGKAGGGWFEIPGDSKVVVVCEGFATGASIHMATGLHTVVAFSASNLKAVATVMRGRHSNAKIIIAGDNDDAGRKCAADAAKAVAGKAVFPDGVNDFNDLACAKGIELVADAICPKIAPPLGYDAASVTGEFKAPDYLIKGVLNRGDMSVTFGDSGSMKSFVELDKALRMGMGWAWQGHKVKRAFTLIVLGEGAGGYRRRVRAWLQHHNLLNSKDQPWVWVIDKAAELCGKPAQLSEWIEQVEEHTGRKVDHVLIDTLNTNMGQGGDENDAVAVGTMLAVAQASAHGGAITFVHHVGHGDKARERGSYAIRGNMDNRTLVERDMDGKGKVITVSSLKVKDGEEFKPVNMTYEVIVLGTDSDGDDITSLVMVDTDMEPESKPKAKGTYKGKNAQIFEQALLLTVKETGNNSKESVRERFMMIHTGESGAKRKAWSDEWARYMNNSCKEVDE